MLLSVSRPSHVFCLSKPSVLFAQGLSTFPRTCWFWVDLWHSQPPQISTHFHQSTSSNSHHSLVFSCFPFSLRIPALSKGYTGPVHIVILSLYPPLEFRDKKGEPNWIILSLFPASFQSDLWSKVFPIAGCVLWRKKSVRGDFGLWMAPIATPKRSCIHLGSAEWKLQDYVLSGSTLSQCATFEMGGLLHMV